MEIKSNYKKTTKVQNFIPPRRRVAVRRLTRQEELHFYPHINSKLIVSPTEFCEMKRIYNKDQDLVENIDTRSDWALYKIVYTGPEVPDILQPNDDVYIYKGYTFDRLYDNLRLVWYTHIALKILKPLR